MSKAEKVDVEILVIALVYVMCKGLNGMDLLEVFFQRRIQPLQARAHPMWMYQGSDDHTHVHLEELMEQQLEEKIMAITPVRDTPTGTRMVPPFSVETPSNEVS